MEQDYLQDLEFCDMYNYLRYDQLTNDVEKDRRLMLIAENYYLENYLLYKISLPRGKKESRLRPIFHQLCVPKKFRNNILTQFHTILGHYRYQRLMPTLSARFYWRNLCSDIREYVRTCTTCHLSKVPTRRPISPLYPLPVPSRPLEQWGMDYKTLALPTVENNRHILIYICHFSGYVVLVPTQDQTAETTAKVFMRETVAHFSLPRMIYSDKGSNFMPKFFGYVTKVLGIPHRSSAALAPRSNGLSEMAIKRVAEGLRKYSTDEIDDRHIEIILPIIQMSLLATSAANTKISPFEVVHGFPIPLPNPVVTEQPTFLSKMRMHIVHG